MKGLKTFNEFDRHPGVEDLTLNKLSIEIHKDNVKKGFYDDGERNVSEMIMLVVTELAEAVEALRKENNSDLLNFFNHYKQEVSLAGKDDAFRIAFETHAKNGFQDEIADSMIRLFDLCGYLEIDIHTAVMNKLKYNRLRPYKHDKKF